VTRLVVAEVLHFMFGHLLLFRVVAPCLVLCVYCLSQTLWVCSLWVGVLRPPMFLFCSALIYLCSRTLCWCFKLTNIICDGHGTIQSGSRIIFLTPFTTVHIFSHLGSHGGFLFLLPLRHSIVIMNLSTRGTFPLCWSFWRNCAICWPSVGDFEMYLIQCQNEHSKSVRDYQKVG